MIKVTLKNCQTFEADDSMCAYYEYLGAIIEHDNLINNNQSETKKRGRKTKTNETR